MLEQYVKSIVAQFVKYEPMNAYVQKMPKGVSYPCYVVNKCDIQTQTLNAFYFVNTVTLFVRMFSNNEVDLKNRAFNLTNKIFEEHRKIPILNPNGSESGRVIRIENIESIEIPVDENDIYCVEINFSFDTTHNVTVGQFALMQNFHLNPNTSL